MKWFGDEAWCNHKECAAHEKRFVVELPRIDVKMTPVVEISKELK